MSDGLPYVGLKDLAYIFKYKNVESARKAVQRGQMPVPTYKLAGQIVADREVVREFFALQREAGLQELIRCPHCDGLLPLRQPS